MNNRCYILPPWLAMNEIRCRCVSDVILGVFRLIFFFFFGFWDGLIPDPDKNWLPGGASEKSG